MSPSAALDRRPPAALPLMLLTGFLGAGKTTLLNQLVQSRDFARSVVLINEFGDVAIDHLLVEQADGDLLTLASGCVCCSVRGDLVTMLEDLLRRRDNGRMAPFDRVVIETTGLAEPGPILNAVALHPYLVLRFRVDSVVTVVDAQHGIETLAHHHEAVDQVAMADALVLTKSDLVTDTAPLLARLASLNPHARLFDASAATAAALLGLAPPQEPRPGAQHFKESDHHHHHDGIDQLVLTATQPLPAPAVPILLDLLRAAAGPGLLRAKGLLVVADDAGRPLVVQIVQGTLHPLRRLPAWPDADRTSRLVVIGRVLPEPALRRVWAAFLEAPAIDQPDGAALALGRDGGPGLF